MLSNKPIQNLVFLSIETASQYPSIKELPNNLLEIFKSRYQYHIDKLIEKASAEDIYNDKQDAKTKAKAAEILNHAYNDKAALTAEFGKIICISAGVVDKNNKLNIYTHYSDEKAILNWLAERHPIKSHTQAQQNAHIVSFSGKSFDYSFLAKRYVLNGLEIPLIFETSGLKPWEIVHLHDVSDAYKFGSFSQEYTSLELLSTLFGIESSPIKGDQIKDLYWKETNFDKIKAHCEAKVWSLANIYVKMKNLNINLTK